MEIYNWFRKIWHLISYRFKKSKIHINKAVLSGNNNFIDIRYTLSRPDKMKKNISIYLIDETSGNKLNLMKLARFGSIYTTHNKYQNSGMLLFRNSENLITPNSKVTLIYGDLQKKDITIS